MKIRSIEPVDDKQVTHLRRLARVERRKEHERVLKMTMKDWITVLHTDLSANASRLQADFEDEQVLLPLPPEQIGPYEDPIVVRLLLTACQLSQALLVRFDCEPSKALESRLRQSAKGREMRIQFFRLIDAYAIVKVGPVAAVPPDFRCGFSQGSL